MFHSKIVFGFVCLFGIASCMGDGSGIGGAGGSSGGDCTEGESNACTCPGNPNSGAQICTNGSFGTCDCGPNNGTGGATATGGTTGTGGSTPATGGSTSTGGTTSTGGATGTGGSSSTGGATGTGGATVTACVPGASATCTCSNGNSGAQACKADGSGLNACVCASGTGGSTPSSTGGATGTGGSTSTGGATVVSNTEDLVVRFTLASGCTPEQINNVVLEGTVEGVNTNYGNFCSAAAAPGTSSPLFARSGNTYSCTISGAKKGGKVELQVRIEAADLTVNFPSRTKEQWACYQLLGADATNASCNTRQSCYRTWGTLQVNGSTMSLAHAIDNRQVSGCNFAR